MKKIENIIDNCKDCCFCLRYKHPQECRGTAFICDNTNPQRLIVIDKSFERIDIPDWCPLETYKEPQSAPVFAPRTVRLCGLDWMAEDLTSHGGTDIIGRTYYTQDEALAAARRIGHGWRLPTKEEHVALAALGSTWVNKGPNGLPGRWFGGNHNTNHKGSVFFEASGLLASNSGIMHFVGANGYAWSSSPYSASDVSGAGLNFNSSDLYPEYCLYRAYSYPVRLVRVAE